MKLELETLADWSPAKRVETKHGPRNLRIGHASESFWDAWRANKDELKAAGIGCGKNRDGEWEATWWQPLTDEETEQMETAIKASRATSVKEKIPAPIGQEYLPFQAAGIKYAAERDRCLIGDEMGLGKQQPLSSGILTPDGWKTMGDMRVGMDVIGSDGKPHKVTGVYPQGVNPVYKVRFTDRTSVRCGAEHLWTVTDRNGRTSTLPLSEMMSRSVLYADGTCKYMTPKLAPVERDEKVYAIHPYVLGVLIGDGSLTGTSVEWSTPDMDRDIVDRVEELIPDSCRITERDTGSCKQYRVASLVHKQNEVLDSIRAYGLDVRSEFKAIPHDYMMGSCEQRVELLRGLMDTDGSCSANRNTYHTISRSLAEDVASLVRSLGGIAVVRQYDRQPEGKPVEYQINVRTPFCPFHSDRKKAGWRPDRRNFGRAIASIEPDGKEHQQCIMVDSPDHLYVTDGYKLTHNTIQAIGVVNCCKDIKRVLVLCPASLRLNWERELNAWLVKQMSIHVVTDGKAASWEAADVVIVNYDVVKKHRKAIDAVNWDLLIIDECFPAHVKVSTDCGEIAIGEIVENEMDVQVASWNSGLGRLEYKPITQHFKIARRRRMARVIHSHGVLECTENHELFVEGKGYVEAKDIEAGSSLRILQSSIRSKTMEHSVLQQGMFCSWEEKESNDARHEVENFSKSEREVCRGVGAISSRNALKENVAVQSDGKSVCNPKDDSDEERKRNFESTVQAKRRKRKVNGARIDAVRSVGFALEDASCNTDRAKRWWISHELQSGSRQCGRENCNRSGREGASVETAKGLGQKENSEIVFSRVEGVEVLELGDRRRHSEGAEDCKYVYCLEVGDNHNFFADGVLVSNCQYLKNSKAARTKSVYGDGGKGGIKAARTIALSGTPLVNRPIELWTLVEHLDPDGLGKNFFGFAKKYCDAHNNGYGWDFSGASNLDMLQRLLRERIMVRREKSQVLTELPAKRRQVIVLPANGAASKVKAEQKAVNSQREAMIGAVAAVELAKAESQAAYDAAVEELQVLSRADFSEISKMRHDVALAKVPYVVKHVEDMLDSGPVVLFGHHRDVISELADHFGDRCVTLTGETSMENRQRAVDRFQAGEVDVFIGNIQAAGVGITLVRASQVVFAELDWVPGNLSQAEDRCHRIGQSASVNVHHLVLDGSIDAQMAHTIIAKQQVIDAALDHEIDLEELKKPLLYHETEVGEACTKRKSRPKIEELAKSISTEQAKAIHSVLRLLASMCDGARELDGCGFNKFDARIGRSLAEMQGLTPKQAALGQIMIRKYKRQLPEDLVKSCTKKSTLATK